jgi:hypothetical protein
MMRRVALVLAACSASPHAGEPARPLAEGITISIYGDSDRSYGVIDDRRWVTVTDGSIVLDRIDPAAALESLVIEPIKIASCVRERSDRAPEALRALGPKRASPLPAGVLSPLVRCRVTASAGRHLVRVLHVSPALQYQTRHHLVMTAPDRAAVETRFAIPTPAWGSRGDVHLFSGLPGSDKSVRELAHGKVLLDGAIAILATPRVDVPARLRAVFDGVADDGSPTTEIAWGALSHSIVWVWAELEQATELAPGPVHVELALPGQPRRDLDLTTPKAQMRNKRVRLPLFADDQLRGHRKREVKSSTGSRLVERLRVSVSNRAEVAREVWIEERLRPVQHRALEKAEPSGLQLGGKILTHRVLVPPGGSGGLDVTIRYDLQ